MNFAMWRKALNVIPEVSKEEWDGLDVISKWLISTRAAVLVMTFISAALAGLFAWRDNSFSFLLWITLTLGLILAHASNNLLNDYVDYARGVDQENYYRAMYGPQPLAHGLMTKRQHLYYFIVSGLLALLCGLYLIWHNGFDPIIWALLGAGAFLLLFYTWPLKYIALGELAVFLVWGPLMIGGAAVLCVSLALLGFASGGMTVAFWPILLAGWCIMGMAYAASITPSGLLLRRSAQAEDRPAVFAAQFALSHACWLVAYPLAGQVGAASGQSAAFFALAALAMCGFLIALWLWPARDPQTIDHEHPDLPANHPHRLEHLRDRKLHVHDYVIDDLHQRWPG